MEDCVVREGRRGHKENLSRGDFQIFTAMDFAMLQDDGAVTAGAELACRILVA